MMSANNLLLIFVISTYQVNIWFSFILCWKSAYVPTTKLNGYFNFIIYAVLYTKIDIFFELPVDNHWSRPQSDAHVLNVEYRKL